MSLTPEQVAREREAFDKWFRDHYDIPLIRNSRAEAAWLARAALKEAECAYHADMRAERDTFKEQLEASEKSRHNLRLFANNETYFDLPMSGPDIDTRNRLFELRAEARADELRKQAFSESVSRCAQKVQQMVVERENLKAERDTALADLATAREECERLQGEKPNDEQDICGLCGEPGADKMAKWTGGGVYWPQENKPDTELVHEACEDEECRRASDLCQGKERESFLRNI